MYEYHHTAYRRFAPDALCHISLSTELIFSLTDCHLSESFLRTIFLATSAIIMFGSVLLTMAPSPGFYYGRRIATLFSCPYCSNCSMSSSHQAPCTAIRGVRKTCRSDSLRIILHLNGSGAVYPGKDSCETEILRKGGRFDRRLVCMVAALGLKSF